MAPSLTGKSLILHPQTGRRKTPIRARVLERDFQGQKPRSKGLFQP
jgi:hypothetical protein